MGHLKGLNKFTPSEDLAKLNLICSFHPPMPPSFSIYFHLIIFRKRIEKKDENRLGLAAFGPARYRPSMSVDPLAEIVYFHRNIVLSNRRIGRSVQ